MKMRATFFCTLFLCAGIRPALPRPAAGELKLATWNLEWFMKPETLRALTPACIPRDASRDGARRAVPCDVAHELQRGSQDIRALRAHARRLDADIVALQEVDGGDAARLIFPGYDFCFSSRVHVQNNGFAIRHGLPHACAPDITALSNSDDVRRGVELRVFPDTPREMRLLSVHLKSGCARDAIDSTRANCVALRAQIPALEQWIDAQAVAGKPFAVLGDFNRDLRQEMPGAGLWADLDDGDPAASDLVNTAEGQSFQNCMPQQSFSGYIDYIVLGRAMARGLVPQSFGRALYRPRDAARRKLSDHCPVFIRLTVADATANPE
jgi:endonuclease/exonuclease/phosphatase family metal-dependent hydrolase